MNGSLQQGWYKGADALIMASSRSISVIAAGEIKSYRARLRDMLRQLAQHLRRLALGAEIEGRRLNPAHAHFVACDHRGRAYQVPLTATVPVGKIARVAIRPRRANKPVIALRKWRRQVWLAELPYPTRDLTSAAYVLTDWFLGQAGKEVFQTSRQSRLVDVTDRIPNPWPHKTPEEAGQNRLREAMYSIGQRPALWFGRASRGVLRIRRVFAWLYNSICYGYSRATGDDMQWPEDHPKLPRIPSAQAAQPEAVEPGNPRVQAVIKRVFAAYRKSRLKEHDVYSMRHVGGR